MGRDLPSIHEIREFRLHHLAVQLKSLRFGEKWDVEEAVRSATNGADGARGVLILAVARSLEMEFRARRAETPEPSDLNLLNDSFLALKSLGIHSENSRLSSVYAWLSVAYAKLVFNTGNYENARHTLLQALQSAYRPDPEDRAEWLMSYAESALESGFADIAHATIERVAALGLPDLFQEEFAVLQQRILCLKSNPVPMDQDAGKFAPWVAGEGRMRLGRQLDERIKSAGHAELVTIARKSPQSDQAILACLKLYALESRAMLTQIPSIRTFRSQHFQAHAGSRRTAPALKALELLASLYDRRISISERMRRLGTSSNITLNQLPIESRLLTLAAIARFAKRHGQMDLALDAMRSYQDLSNTISSATNSDMMAVMPSVETQSPAQSHNRVLGVAKLVSSAAWRIGATRLRSFGASRAEYESLTAEQWQDIGESFFAVLSGYRGGLMKLGQVLSMVPNIPERLRFMLQALRYDAEPTDVEKLREILARDLPESVQERLTIESLPLAVGSIAQIHRGRLDERDIVIKIKHPDIAASIRQDLKILRVLKPLFSLALPLARIDDILRELSELLLSETDFAREAETQRLLHRAYKSSRDCIVPAVFGESQGDVLIMEYCEGRSFAEFCQDATQHERNEAGVKIVKFVLRSLLKLGIFNGDPHPGNFLFCDDDKVAFLDFGFSRKFDSVELELWNETLRSTVDHDRPAFASVVSRLGLVGDPRKFDIDEHWALNALVFKPFMDSAAFQFTDEFVANVISRHFSGKNGRYISPPPSSLVLYRIVFGLYGLLAELNATARWQDIYREVMAETQSSIA